MHRFAYHEARDLVPAAEMSAVPGNENVLHSRWYACHMYSLCRQPFSDEAENAQTQI